MTRDLWVLATAAATLAALVLVDARATAVPAAVGAAGGSVGQRGVLVYLEGVPGPEPEPPATHARIRQKDLTFLPDVSIMIKGTTVDFPNDDKVFHNVFSLSEPSRFDLGLYKSGDSKSVQFNRPGVVDIYCNIHPQMAAKVKVLDTRYFAISTETGAFFIPNVPPGTYPIVAWQPYGDPARGTINVGAGQTTNVTLALPPAQSKERHLRKDGTPYGRYQ